MNYSDLNVLARVYFNYEEKEAFVKKLGYSVIKDVPTEGWVSAYHNTTEDFTSTKTVAVKDPSTIHYNDNGYASDRALKDITVEKVFEKEMKQRIKNLLLTLNE